jgi:hypothetical protein
MSVSTIVTSERLNASPGNIHVGDPFLQFSEILSDQQVKCMAVLGITE